jgi:hypothetical protein
MVTKHLFPKLTEECIEFVNATDYKNYFKNKKPLDNDDNKTSLKKIHSLLKGRGFGNLLDEILPFYNPKEVDYSYFQAIENYITTNISKYINTNNDEDLINIFHAIQFWGGSEARGIYVMGDKSFELNFNINDYRNLFSFCKQPEKLKIINYCKNRESRKIKQFATSFITKHVKFFTRYFHSKNNPELVLPVFDRNICEIMFDSTCPDKFISHYYDYLPKLCKIKDCTPELFENVLFSKSQS